MMLLLNAEMSRTSQERVGRELMVRPIETRRAVEKCCVLRSTTVRAGARQTWRRYWIIATDNWRVTRR